MGKGTVVRSLMSGYPSAYLSVSVTTRRPRPGERAGVDYLFVTDEEFDRLVTSGELLEWAEIYGHRSGTPAEPIRRALQDGRDAVLEIDVQGARSIKREVPDAVLIFLTPPSMAELERRLRARGTEEGAELAGRLAKAEWELAQRSWFDHIVVNEDVDEATNRVAAIIEASIPTIEGPTIP